MDGTLAESEVDLALCVQWTLVDSVTMIVEEIPDLPSAEGSEDSACVTHAAHGVVDPRARSVDSMLESEPETEPESVGS